MGTRQSKNWNTVEEYEMPFPHNTWPGIFRLKLRCRSLPRSWFFRNPQLCRLEVLKVHWQAEAQIPNEILIENYEVTPAFHNFRARLLKTLNRFSLSEESQNQKAFEELNQQICQLWYLSLEGKIFK